MTAAIACPGCGATMASSTLDGHLGTRVDLDYCPTCQVIWFDRLESLRLTPGSTLTLFHVIAERKQQSPPPLRQPLACPRCDLRLLETYDRQRNTPFRYWRCAREHGRLITFFDFLREKDFIRPLSARQIADLRANIQTINCSNCGAPIDLTNASECTHCGTPLSMLDLDHIEKTAAQLRHADDQRQVDADLAARLAQQKREVDAFLEMVRAERGGTPFGLIEAGLRLITGRK